ncbi:DUF397 domain-containing protein [Saccharothrix sp. NRRL B-16314]|uniref:DUF397 domain-containing protein n=1 Tax=Saccharothrix sp. NRRL B-16314 TaxID=1463825 RepID=UPI000526E07B|nr:DUF397 domain-containing protein [Saccharothrix sp. NRRL B-16314]
MQREWRKSTRSSAGGPECVEIVLGPAGAGVRDSKNPTGVELGFGATPWDRFVGTAKNGVVDSR